jgi:tetratricopeptide (TPR) repeat protein
MKRKFIILSACLLLSIGLACIYKCNHPTMEKVEFESQFKHATQLLLNGEIDTSIQIYKKLLNIDSHYPAIYFNLGRAFLHRKEFDDALTCFDKALSLHPNFAHLIHYHCAIACDCKNDKAQAFEHIKKAISLKPDYKEALYFAGTLAQKNNELDQAYAYFRASVSDNKEYRKSILSLGIAYRNEQKFDKAITCFEYARTLDPHDYYTYLMLGDVINMNGDPDRAISMYEKACELNPQCHEAWNNLGTIYGGVKDDLKKSKYYLTKACEIKPDHAGTRGGLSALYLCLGDFEQGWKEYEYRLQPFFDPNPRIFEKPRWDGIESLHGKTIFLYAEQGLGDTFQFIRYAALLKKQGATIIAEVQKPLVKIMKMCPYLDKVICACDQIPSHDLQAPLMSLPYLCKTSVKTIPHEVPYLYADPNLIDYWKHTLSTDKNFKIGICWCVEQSHDSDVYRGYGKTVSVAGSKRSIGLQAFEQLKKFKGISFYSLQKDLKADQLKSLAPGFKIHDFGDDYDKTHGSFMDTAAIMKNLDLVITADTSIAHLAGGLGVPTWILLSFPAEWRWMRNRSDSPWYPSMQLFRKQPSDKDWSMLLTQVGSALRKRLA